MNADQFALVRRLLHTAAIDQARAYTSTWSMSRFRTVMMDKVLAGGHRLIEAEVHGTPAFARTNKAATEEEEPDLKIQPLRSDASMFVDLLCGSFQAEPDAMAAKSTYDKILRLASGRSDVLLVSADVDAYERVRTQPAQKRKEDDPVIRVVAAVLPAAAKVSASEKHRVTLGDVSLEAVGVKTMAFGTARVACAVYVRWDV